ncbi:MAG TPA: hypothetical protein VGM53_11080 [Streptosporangiaceae bacterium]
MLDHEVQASITRVNGEHDPDTGWYGVLHHTGCPDYDRAKEIKRALYRSARHLKVSLHTKIFKATDGSWTVEFVAINKAHGRAYVAQQSNGDPTRLAYNPYHRPSLEK